MKVRWTEAAIEDLRALQSYIARRSPSYSGTMVERIIDRTSLLAEHPQIGVVVAEYGSADLRELLESPYRIIYRILAAQIDIVAVIHAARSMPSVPPRSAAGQ